MAGVMHENSLRYNMAIQRGKSIDTKVGEYDPRISASSGNLSSWNVNFVQTTANGHHPQQNGALLKETNGEAAAIGCTSSKKPKKPRVIWTRSLHNRFLQAIQQIGIQNLAPKRIHEIMNVPGLTRKSVASHLQKYRTFLRDVAKAIRSSRVADKTLISSFLFDLPDEILNTLWTKQSQSGISRVLDSQQMEIEGSQTNALTTPAYGTIGTQLTSQEAFSETSVPWFQKGTNPSPTSYNSLRNHSGIHINGKEKTGELHQEQDNGSDSLDSGYKNIPSNPENYRPEWIYARNSNVGVEVQGCLNHMTCNGDIVTVDCEDLLLSNKNNPNSNSSRAFSDYSGNQTKGKVGLTGISYPQPRAQSSISDNGLIKGTPDNTLTSGLIQNELTSGLIQNDSFRWLNQRVYMPQSQRASHSNLTSALPGVGNLVNEYNSGHQVTSILPPFISNQFTDSGSACQGNSGTRGLWDMDLCSSNSQFRTSGNLDPCNICKEDFCSQNANQQGCGEKFITTDWCGSVSPAERDASANQPKNLDEGRSKQMEENDTWNDLFLSELECDGMLDRRINKTVTVEEPYSAADEVTDQKQASGETVNFNFYRRPQAEGNSSGTLPPINENICDDQFVMSLLRRDALDKE